MPQSYKLQSSSGATSNSLLLCVLLAFIPVCVFLNTLHSGFVYDDIGVIEDNYFIRSLSNVPKIFSQDYFNLSHELSYRPVVTLSYFADYAVWGLKPFGYHLTNVILHAVNTILLYLLLLRLMGQRAVALLAAVIFSIHPCVTEAVNAISYREDIFVALFSFLSCLFLILSSGRRYPILHEKENVFLGENKPPNRLLQRGKANGSERQLQHALVPERTRRVYYALSLVCYFLSLFSKETAIVTPLFILLYWILCMRKKPASHRLIQEALVNSPSIQGSNTRESFNTSKTKSFNYFIDYYLGYILITLFYVLIRFFVLKNPLEVSVGYLKGSIPINFMTMVKILAAYVKLMFFPFHLSADYLIDPVLSVFDTSFIMSMILLSTAGVIIFKTVNITRDSCNQTEMRGQGSGVRDRASGVKSQTPDPRSPIPPKGQTAKEMFFLCDISKIPRIYSLFMLCFFVALLPVLNIVPIGHIMAERYLYLPVAGFCAVLGGLFFGAVTVQSPLKKPKAFSITHNSALNKHMYVIPLISILCISFTTKTILRNRDWKNEYTFWTRILKEQPQNYDAHNNLGGYFYKQGDLDKAICELEEAVKLKKNYPEGHNSLGTMYIDKGFIDKAVTEYTEAVKYKHNFPQAYYNLGNACIKKGLLDDSIAFFKKAIDQGMYNPQVYNNLGSAYIKKGMLDEAIAQYQRALAVYRDFAEVHSNLGYVYTEKGDFDRAVSELKEALRLQPNHANAHNNLGALYCQKGLWDMAQDEFLKAIGSDPKNASAHKNIGMIYFTRGDKQKARQHFVQMLKYDPNYIKDAGIYAIVSELGLIKKSK